MKIFLLAVVALTCCSVRSLAESESVWLVIGATAAELAPVMTAKEQLQQDWPEALIVATDDCANLRSGLYVLTVTMATAETQARKTLAELKKHVPDAYLKSCRVKENSRLAMGVPLIDPSIWEVPKDVVNWTDRDRISEIRSVPGAGYLLIRRIYDPQDPSLREGRQQMIYYFRDDPRQAELLSKNCWDFGGIDVQGSLLAFHCATMVAGDYLIHTSQVFRLQPPHKVAEQAYCRNPVLLEDNRWRCQQESVNAEGMLSLDWTVPTTVPSDP